MKRTELMDALDKLYPAVAGRPMVEEMGDFRIAGDTLTACDGATMVRTRMPETTGIDCRIPAEAFRKLISSMKTDEVELSLDGDSLVVNNKTIRGKYKISTEAGLFDNLDFDVPAWKPLSDEFLKGLRLCRFAVSKDTSRGVLCGIHVAGTDMITSDGFRIAKYECGSLSDEPITISVAVAAQIEKHKVTEYAVKGDTIYFRCGDTIIAGKLIVGMYPPAGKFLDEAKGLKSVVEFPEGIRETLARHSDQQGDMPITDKEVTVKFADKRLTVTSTDGVAYELAEELGVEGDAELSFKIHPDNLADILGRTRQMNFDQTNKFVTFKDEKFVYLATIERV